MTLSFIAAGRIRGAWAAVVLAAPVWGLALFLSTAAAQDQRQNAPGKFDFYVLALSWSPSYCEAAAERGRETREQCGARPYSFVVHGLWPQYERGFPEFCQVPAPKLDRGIVSSMLDLMPSPRLIFQQWDKHGTCSGLAPRAYFETVRKARAVVKIPPEFLDVKTPLTVTPNEVEEAFVKANPGLARAGLAVTCDSRRLHEVRICLTKDYKFRDCPEVDRRACRRDRLLMPPVRGG
ncbi:MAG TPA: ribonuclease T2 [Xanthobacteraceae bacterium]|nr:ribonuclease T2 [Xanthobacteraceae bacterium]